MASGGHEPIASKVYPRLTNVDTLLLEDDRPRAGDFGPLRHVRPDTTVVLGLMTTKDATLESGEAQRFVPRERLALSPQCGFASVEGGNPLTETQQEAKLRRLAEVARRVWPA
jgi:5-methyltetrahydropteroyltriglutamate--homocysteine methyltransferase